MPSPADNSRTGTPTLGIRTDLWCAICNTPNAEPCEKCHTTGWCAGGDCRDRDWPAHDILCKTWNNARDRPERPHGFDAYALAILFPAEGGNPRLVWVVLGQGGTFGREIDGTAIGRLIADVSGEDIEERTFKIRKNIRRGFSLSTRGRVEIRCAGSPQYKKLPINQSLLRFGDHTALRQLRGPAVIVRSTLDDPGKSGTLEDITLRDFRSALDYCWSFNFKQIPELRPSSIKQLPAPAVRIQSRGEICHDPKDQHAHKQFITETIKPKLWVNKNRIQRLHPVFDAPLSPLSQLIDCPLYVRRIKHAEECSCSRRARTENVYASFLMIDYDVMSKCFGQPLTSFGLHDDVGGVLVARIDRMKLHIGQVEAISHYSRNTLDEIHRYLWDERKNIGGMLSDSFNVDEDKQEKFRESVAREVSRYATPEYFDMFFELYRVAASKFEPDYWKDIPSLHLKHQMSKQPAKEIAARRARCEKDVRMMFERMGSDWKSGPTHASRLDCDSDHEPPSSAISTPVMIPQRKRGVSDLTAL